MSVSIRVSRRRFLSTGAVAASALPLRGLAALEPAPAVCVLTPEQETGPFYLADELIRSHIAEDRKGVPLRLRLVVVDSRTCEPLHGAAVDLWHCDAMGLYSGFTKSSFGGPGGPGGHPPGPPPEGFAEGGMPPPPPSEPGTVEGNHRPGPPAARSTDKLTFLRGIQLTGADGSVTFETIFPGFYDGRTNHVHFTVRMEGHRQGRTYVAGHIAHTGQIFFPEDWNVRLMKQTPYAAHSIHRTTQAEDGVFEREHGAAVIATLLPVDATDPAAGLVAELRVAVDPTATPKPVGMGGPPPRR